MVLHHYMSVNPITGFHLTPDNNSPATLLRVVIKKCFQALSAWGQNHLQVTTTDLYENLKKKKARLVCSNRTKNSNEGAFENFLVLDCSHGYIQCHQTYHLK